MLNSIRRNFSYARLNRHEIAGSLGDIGTFLPLLVGMAVTNGLDFAAGLFFAGFFNIVTGLTFSVPMAVQPMKAIAAIAITEHLTVPQILAAGICVSVIVGFLGVTGLVDWINKYIPKSVVRGVQLGLGLSLAIKGCQMIGNTGVVWGLDSFTVGILAALVVLTSAKFRSFPAALILFFAGIVVAVAGHPAIIHSIGFNLSFPHFVSIAGPDFQVALFRAAIPQIPLTLLNSVIAVCALSTDLFPDRPVSVKKVALSVATMNLVAAWFGGMPMCHGAGGLAGQHKFGARTNGSILFLGVSKMLIAVFLGASLMGLCQVFPASILGVMLAFSGLGLALICRDQTNLPDVFVMILTAGLGIAFNSITIAFLIGWAVSMGLKLKVFSV